MPLSFGDGRSARRPGWGGGNGVVVAGLASVVAGVAGVAGAARSGQAGVMGAGRIGGAADVNCFIGSLAKMAQARLAHVIFWV